MANTKYKPLEQLSGWIEYRLDTERLDPPVFRCRLRPITGLNMIDGSAGGEGFKLGRALQEAAVEAVAAWELEADGVPLPLDPDTKRGWLLPILDQPVTGKPGVLLGIAIVADATNRETFLKN